MRKFLSVFKKDFNVHFVFRPWS